MKRKRRLIKIEEQEDGKIVKITGRPLNKRGRYIIWARTRDTISNCRLCPFSKTIYCDDDGYCCSDLWWKEIKKFDIYSFRSFIYFYPIYENKIPEYLKLLKR